MRAIVVGCRGFVGSAITDLLRVRGVDVVAVDRDNYAPLRGASADHLINASGSSDRRLADADPVASFRANVDTTMSTLVDFRYRQYVLVSSVAVYDRPGGAHHTKEDTEIRPERLSHYGFFKYLAELVVRRHAKNWLVVRLGALVGPGLRKNSIFDLLSRRTLYVHPESRLSYVDTREVAGAIWSLLDEDRQIYNVCGPDDVSLAEVAGRLGIELPAESYGQAREDFVVNSEKLAARVELPDSLTAIERFAREWRAGSYGKRHERADGPGASIE